jgi:hypothetical protein
VDDAEASVHRDAQRTGQLLVSLPLRRSVSEMS